MSYLLLPFKIVWYFLVIEFCLAATCGLIGFLIGAFLLALFDGLRMRFTDPAGKDSKELEPRP